VFLLSSNPTSSARNNSFGFVRFLAASGVIFSHHFAIAGHQEPQMGGVTLGAVSVFVFFFMSGYLIYSSINRNPDFARFISARILRILPNLVLVLSVTSIATMLYYANTSHVLDHVRYILQNIVMLVRGGPAYNVPGIWEGRPFSSLNGSIWSLPYEVWCYFILFAVLKFTASAARPALIAVFLCCALLYILPDFQLWPSALGSMQLGRLGLWFFAGALCAAYAFWIPLLHSSAMASFERHGDPSYGMYIMAWPVQQAMVLAIPNFWLSMLASLLTIVVLGYVTWHGLEKHALKNVGALTALLKRFRHAR
jgi:peptidoglycan/LPS O-acetylase OafA/YrhL